MYPTLVLALALGAPAPKDPPKVNDLVGEWVAERIVKNGKPLDRPGDLRYTFRVDGTYTLWQGEKAIGSRNRGYTFDPAADPPAINMNTRPGGRDGSPGIYRVDGDTLTMCFDDPRAGRPKGFGAPAGSSATLIVFRRVKKD